MSEDETLWRGNTWTNQVLHTATIDRAEQSWVIHPSVIEFCVLRVFILCVQIVNTCWVRRAELMIVQKYCEIGWGI
jgi:hypothetical protein